MNSSSGHACPPTPESFGPELTKIDWVVQNRPKSSKIVFRGLKNVLDIVKYENPEKSCMNSSSGHSSPATPESFGSKLTKIDFVVQNRPF